ncbi:MFS transporter [Pseudonocardia humida]|uniref:MFS transporter n=1 Tax=Pseudonocardia humida TaxID=2800819 RepID=UPI00207CB2A4|nr:MFS transporter [Pseudonocardia humida]
MPTSGSSSSRATAEQTGDPGPASVPLPDGRTGSPAATSPGDPPAEHARIGILRLLRLPGYRRLLGVRFPAQFSDGMFQTALGGAVLFNPERQADPIAVAAGLAVLLLPYSVIGPFAGALLDRWDRKRVLVVASLVRALLTVGVAATVYAGADGAPLYLGALLVAGLSRFVGAGLSVGLPHLVPRANLVEANAFAVTVGAGMTATGAAAAIGVRALVGAGDAGSAVTTLTSLLGGLVAAAVAAGFRRGVLGPDRAVAQQHGAVATALRGLADGARATRSTPSVTASFVALAAHRVAFGISTLLMLLLFRYAFTAIGPLRVGLAGIGQTVGVAAAGLGTAALVTPWAVRHWGRARLVRAALVLAAVAQLGLVALLSLPAVFVAAYVLGLVGQVLKLCTDAAVQGEAGDGVLGRVFAIYDIVFNVGFVAAVTAAATLSPPDGRAPALLAASAGLYLVGLLGHDLVLRRRHRA